jgi:hypothetical protein
MPRPVPEASLPECPDFPPGSGASSSSTHSSKFQDITATKPTHTTMNSITSFLRIAGFGSATLLAVAASAQTISAPGAAPDSGLLGKRYVSIDLATENFRHIPVNNRLSEEIDVNLPVASMLDFDFGYAHAQIDDLPLIEVQDQQIGGDVTAYKRLGALKPFASVGLSHTWEKASNDFGSVRDDYGAYDLGVGAEYSVNRFISVDANADFGQTLGSDKTHTWVYTVGIHAWMTPKVCAAMHVSFNQGDSVSYEAGVRLVF